MYMQTQTTNRVVATAGMLSTTHAWKQNQHMKHGQSCHCREPGKRCMRSAASGPIRRGKNCCLGSHAAMKDTLLPSAAAQLPSLLVKHRLHVLVRGPQAELLAAAVRAALDALVPAAVSLALHSNNGLGDDVGGLLVPVHAP